ncbi:neurobeachin-like protein 1 isoform X3 [Styela clava]
MGNTDHLYELWTLYTIKNEAQYLQRYIQEFAHVYEGIIDLNFELVDVKRDSNVTVTEGADKAKAAKQLVDLLSNPKDSDAELGPPNLSELPDGFLQAINRQLMGIRDYFNTAALSVDKNSFKPEKVVYATNLVKSLSVICKNHENLKLLSSASLVGLVLNVASYVVQLITGGNSEDAKTLQRLETFLHHALYLCECLYDPLHTWRKRLRGAELEAETDKNITPLLNVDIIPFFYGTLQTHDRSLSDDLQRHFLHMFGALLCGSQRNALLASSSTTLDILLNFLSRFMGLEDHSNQPSPVKPSTEQQQQQQQQQESGKPKLSLGLPRIEISGDGITRRFNQSKDVEGARLVLRLIIKMVHVLHNAGPDQRQISVKDVLDEYFTLLTKANGNTDMQLQMIRFIPEFLNTLDRPALQMMLLQQGCFNQLKNVLQNYNPGLSTEESEQFSVQFVNIVTALVAGSMSAKEYFQDDLGYAFLFERIRELSTPTKEIFISFLNMAVEAQMLLKRPQPIKNIFVVLMLMQWLPDIKQVEQQIWLASILKRLFTSCNENKIIACLCKVVTKVLVILVSHPHLHKSTVLHLLELIELLGTYSMSPRQTAAYIELLRQDSEQHRHLNPYFGRMLHSLSAMARKDTAERKSSHFFDLQDSTSGITVPEIKKWGGSGFSFHAWLCLNFHPHMKRRSKCRRQLYSFFSSSGTGMEAFFTPECELVIAVCNKKNYLTVKLNEAPLIDNKWHCLHIVHHPAKRPFGSNGTLNVYIDGRLVMTTTLRCANLGETFSMCHVGSAGLRTSASNISLSTPGIPGTPVSELGTPVTPKTYGSPVTPSRREQIADHINPVLHKHLDPLKSRFTFNLPSPRTLVGNFSSLSPTNFSPSAFRSGGSESVKLNTRLDIETLRKRVENASKTDRVVTIDAGTQDDVWGRAVSLRGQLGSVAAFNDVLTEAQVKALNIAGPDKKTVMNSDDVPGDIKSKLVVYYAAKACHRYVCRDLSSSQTPRDGNLTGHKIVTWDVKDSINAIGGVHVLFPLLEEINTMHLNRGESNEAVSPNEVVQDDASPVNEDVSWVMIESPKSSDLKLQKNHVAAFIILLKNFAAHSGTGSIGRHAVNEDMLVQCSGIAIIGALLQKMPAELIDADVLMATQLLVESIDSSTTMGTNLLHQVYQYLLFDFRIWSRSEFTVRIGHIQYLATVIKDNRKAFRKKYGVQYMLDVIKTYYCSSDSQLSIDDTCVIRSSLLGLVKYYAARDITADELSSILGFITASKAQQEVQLCECLDLLSSLLECPCKGQLHCLLYEQGNADLLYVILADQQFSEVIRIKICKMLTRLLKTEYVYEKNKTFLKLQSVGFSSLITRMKDLPPTRVFCDQLLDLVIEIDLGSGALFSVLHFFHRAHISTRRDAAKRLLDLLLTKNGFLAQCVNQPAWQDTLTRLLVKDSDYTESRTGSFSQRSDAGFESLDDVPSLVVDGSHLEPRKESMNEENANDSRSASINGEEDENKNTQQQQQQQQTKSVFDIFNKNLPQSENGNMQTLKKPMSFPEELKKFKDNIITQISSPVMKDFASESFSELTVSEHSSTTSLKQSGKTSPTLSDHYFNFEPRVENLSSTAGSMSNLLDYEAEYGMSLKERFSQIEEDLADAVTEILYIMIWRGIDGTTVDSWKSRGQVFACLNKLSSSHDLVQNSEKLKLRILELCVEAACNDLKNLTAGAAKSNASGANSFLHIAEKSAELIRHVNDFLVNQGSDATHVWSINLMENMFMLFDVLVVWDNNNESSLNGPTEWVELASIGLRLLLGCMNTDKLELVAMAAAKLHHLIHSRSPRSTEEICYLLNNLHKIQCKSIKDDTHVVKFVVPLIRDLLDKNYEVLALGQFLNDLPPTSGSATFFDDFVKYCQSKEWIQFINKHVQHKASQHEEDTFRDSHNQMTKYWLNVMEDSAVACHKRDRDGGESKLKFQAQIEIPFQSRRTTEEERQAKNMKQLFNQHNAALRQWRATKRFLTSGRGPWKDRNLGEVAWKLSNVENFSRMRLKLTENYNFDPHTDASRLRDNVEIIEPVTQMTADDGLIPASAVKQAESAKSSSLEDDSVGDEEWSTLTSNVNTTADTQSQKEKSVFSAECHLVTLMDYIVGKIEISTTHVYFYDSSVNKDEETGRDFKWSLQHLREAHFRRYNLRRSALELFLIDQSNYFINFDDLKQRNAAYKALLSVRPPNLLYFGSRSPQELLKASGLTQKWVQREISNFDYLMQLNTIAGRTYNDLSQYPVFPWIVADYTSEKLDLTNPASFRDLSKPVGVQNPDNEQEVRDKFDNFEDPSGMIEKFHYGTHYSNSAGVLHYMIRMEPFTTLHIQLQSGRFDLADRQFHSIPTSWQAIMDNPNDVKELIPEFFYLPEFLVNLNKFDLGKHQITKDLVNDVILPVWAKTPEEFVFKNRKALESEYVCQNLHHWIDLIFGYKQRGDEAAKALNVFYYCTYEGAVDLDAITDPVQRKAVEGMINNFGQTPTQLLREPHPRRMSRVEAGKKVAAGGRLSPLTGDMRTLSVLDHPDELKAFFVEVMPESDPLVFVSVPKYQARSFIQAGMPDVLVTISKHGILGSHGWLPYDKSITNYFTFEKDPSITNPKLQRKIQGLPIPGITLSARLFVITHDAKLLFVGGHWDNSVRAVTLGRSRNITHLVRHFDIVTCLALDNCGSHLISGSADTTCVIWQIIQHNGVSTGVSQRPLQVLYGHEDEVMCVAINTELDMAVSSSKDGTCIIHTVRKGNYVRTIQPMSNCSDPLVVPYIALSEEGHIALYAHTKKDAKEEKLYLHLYSINGKHLAVDCLESKLNHMTITGEFLISGDVKGSLVIRELFSLEPVSHLTLCQSIYCVSVAKNGSHILVTLRDGKLIIVGVGRPAEARPLFS